MNERALQDLRDTSESLKGAEAPEP